MISIDIRIPIDIRIILYEISGTENQVIQFLKLKETLDMFEPVNKNLNSSLKKYVCCTVFPKCVISLFNVTPY